MAVEISSIPIQEAVPVLYHAARSTEGFDDLPEKSKESLFWLGSISLGLIENFDKVDQILFLGAYIDAEQQGVDTELAAKFVTNVIAALAA